MQKGGKCAERLAQEGPGSRYGEARQHLSQSRQRAHSGGPQKELGQGGAGGWHLEPLMVSSQSIPFSKGYSNKNQFKLSNSGPDRWN